MELRQIKDRSGNVLPVKYYNGINFNPHTIGNVKDHLENLQSLTFGATDIVVWSYPKSGTHWLFEIIRMLLSGSTDYFHGIINTFEFLSAETIQNLKEPRAICTHLQSKYLPKNFIEKKRKILYIFRNPKDAAVSAFNFHRRLYDVTGYRGSWSDFLDLFLNGNVYNDSWFDFDKDVEDFKSFHQDYPILTLCYEDMKKDLLKEIRRISTFLECKRDETFLEQVATKCQAQNMIPAKKTNTPKEVANLSYDRASNVFFRKGDVGDWKNWFTVAQDEHFNEVLEKEASTTKLNLKFTI